VKISDWDHYLITIQNINQQQTDVLNALSFQADSLPIGGAGPLLHKLIRNYYTEIQEEGQDLSTIRKLPLSLGKMLQNQLEQSFKRKQFFIRNIPLWMEPLQKEQRITKEDTGQILSAFPYLMRLKYSFQTEKGKERTENLEKTSTPQTRGEGSCSKPGTETFTKTSLTPVRMDFRIKFRNGRHCFKKKMESPTIQEG